MASVTHPMTSERVARLRAGSAEMEEFLKEEGFTDDGAHRVFVRWQRLTMEQLGEIVIEAEAAFSEKMVALCERVDNSTDKTINVRIAQLDAIFRNTQQILMQAKTSVEAAQTVKEQIAIKADVAIANVAQSMGTRLFGDTQKWLLQAQADRIWTEAWKLGCVLTAVVLLFGAMGYEVRAWQDDPPVTFLARCADNPIVLTLDEGKRTVLACSFEGNAQRRLVDIPSAFKAWLAELFPIKASAEGN